MRTLPKPTDDPEALFLRCVAGYIHPKTQALRQRLCSAAAAIRAAAARYESAAQSTTLHQIPESDTVGGPGTATKSDMVNLYENKLTKVGSPGRALYDKLLSLPPRGICPLCGQGVVSTLDHHLPKSAFPALAVAPTNLVPSCSTCNLRKLVVRP
jgi:5-methylcytosine-specific restriction endonuclease McrA